MQDEDKKDEIIDESAEWDAAEAEFVKEHGLEVDEPEDDKKEDETDEEDVADDSKGDDSKSEDDAADDSADDTKSDSDEDVEDGSKDVEESQPSSAEAIREARATQRQLAEEAEAAKAEVIEKMFPDLTNELKDGEGNPIKSIEDVMQYTNPDTGVAFTQDEAGAYLLQAQKNANESYEAKLKQAEEIADLGLSLHDSVQVLQDRYGDFLKSNPAVRDELWGLYKETLVVDENTGFIVKAPVSMEKFYETNIKPHLALADRQAQEAELADKAAKAEQEAKKLRSRGDREDLYARGKGDVRSKEDQEWAAAEEAVWG